MDNPDIPYPLIIKLYLFLAEHRRDFLQTTLGTSLATSATILRVAVRRVHLDERSVIRETFLRSSQSLSCQNETRSLSPEHFIRRNALNPQPDACVWDFDLLGRGRCDFVRYQRVPVGQCLAN